MVSDIVECARLQIASFGSMEAMQNDGAYVLGLQSSVRV